MQTQKLMLTLFIYYLYNDSDLNVELTFEILILSVVSSDLISNILSHTILLDHLN